MKRLVMPMLLMSCVFFATTSSASPRGPVQIGEHVHEKFETPHPYTAGVNGAPQLVWTSNISFPEATYIAVHFGHLELAPGDYVIVRSADGVQSWTYTRFGRADLGISADGFFATHIKGDTAIVELFASSSSPGWGYSIDRFGRGYSEAEIISFWNQGLGEKMNLPYPSGWEESLCTADDTEEAKCYQASEPAAYEKARAIARLLSNGSAHCTGWLVGSEGHLITNEHCITSQSELDNIDFEFMAEGADCGTYCGTALACPGTIEASGGTFVVDNAGLDYALVVPDTSTGASTDLPATYGFLQLRDTGAVLDERLYIVQHPAGWGKRFSMVSTYPNDVTDGGKTYASSLSEPACAGSGYSDVGYWADTQGGSSGSPVLGYSDNKVIALHHCQGSGGCASGSASDARNRGVPIQLVVDDLIAQGVLPEGAVCDAFSGPAGLTATVNGDNQIDVAWSAVSGILGVTYDVFRSLESCPQNNPEPIAIALTSTSFSDTTVSGGTLYAYSVKAFDPATSCRSDTSPCDSATATGTCTLHPTFDGIETVTNQGTPTCGLEITWGVATTQCSGSVQYSVHRSTTSGFVPDGSNLIASGLTALTFLDTEALPSGQRQYYIVRATDILNSSTDANMVELSGVPTGTITWSDDVESYATIADAVAAGWSHGATAGTDDWAVATGDDATTGTGNAFSSADVSSLTDKWMITSTFDASTASSMSFTHKFAFESGYDGAVIEISTDGGTIWNDLGPFITSGTYNSTISTSFSSPIGGQDAWSGTQASFVTVEVDLTTHVGPTTTVRFRLACDTSVSGGDWLIDDFSISDTCTPGVGGNIFSDGFESGDVSAWDTTGP